MKIISFQYKRDNQFSVWGGNLKETNFKYMLNINICGYDVSMLLSEKPSHYITGGHVERHQSVNGIPILTFLRETAKEEHACSDVEAFLKLIEPRQRTLNPVTPTRNKLSLTSEIPSDPEQLYQHFCDEERNLNLGPSEFLKMVSNKFGLPETEFRHTRILALLLLFEICKSDGMNLKEAEALSLNALIVVSSPYTSLDNHITFRYAKLDEQQRRYIAEKFNRKFGAIAELPEDYYRNGYNLDTRDGIMFKKALFCKEVLPQMILLAKELFPEKFENNSSPSVKDPKWQYRT